MPYLDYYCEKCETQFEIQCGLNDDRTNVKCPDCKDKKVQRVFDTIYLPSKKGKGGGGGGGGKSSCSSCSSGNCSSCG